jgi:hypothetical protein
VAFRVSGGNGRGGGSRDALCGSARKDAVEPDFVLDWVAGGGKPSRLPRHSARGRGQKEGGEEAEAVPPVSGDQIGRGRCVKKRGVLRAFLQIVLVGILSNS